MSAHMCKAIFPVEEYLFILSPESLEDVLDVHLLLQLWRCLFVCFVLFCSANVTQSGVIWEEEMSTEKMLLSDLPVDKPVIHD